MTNIFGVIRRIEKIIYNKVVFPCYMTLIKLTDDLARSKQRDYIKRAYGITIGRFTHGYNVKENGEGSILGSFCSIASGVKIGQMNHPMEYVSINPFIYYKDRGMIAENKDINVKIGSIINDDVWIGNNAVVLPGVTVGRGAVIAAGAVVKRDVPPICHCGWDTCPLH